MDKDFVLDLIASIQQSKSKKQINADIKTLEKAINMLRLTGTLAKGDTKREINSYIKELSGKLSYVKLKAKIDNKNLKREIEDSLHHMTFKEIDALNIDSNKAKLKFQKIVADMKTYAEKTPISININLKKEKLNNDLTTFLNKNSKIRESNVLLAESERLRELIDSVGDKGTLRNATDAFSLFKSEVISTGYAGKSTSQKIKDMLWHITKIGSFFGVASMAVNNFRKSLSTLRSSDTILTEISKTSEMTKQQLKELGDEAFKIASKYGQLSGNYLLGVQEMARSGYESLSKELAELSLLAQSAGNMTAENANNYLLATDAAYKYGGSVEKLNAALDGANYISNKNSASLTDIADATRVSASFAANAGVAIDELTAAEATMIATTKRSGSEMGRAFRSIILNLQQVSGEFDGEIIDEEQLKKVEARCHSLGVELEYVKDGVATLRNPMEVLKDLAKVYNSLPDNSAEKQGLISDLGGKFHANALSGLLSRWDLYEKMLNEFSQGTGSALEEAEKTADSWEGRLAKLQNSWDSFINTLTNKEAIKGGISFFDRLIQGAEMLTSAIGEIPVALTALNSALVATNKDYGITQIWNKDKGKIDLQGNIFGIDFTAIKSMKKHFAEAEEAIQLWNNAISSGGNVLESFDNKLFQNNAQFKEYLSTCSIDAPASLEGYKSYLKSVGVSTDALRLKTILLNSAITMLGGWAIQVVIELAAKGIDNLIHSAEHCKERVDSLMDSYNSALSEANNNAKTVEDLAERYEKLSKGVNNLGQNIALTTDEYEEYNNIVNQIADMFPQLIQGYTDEGTAILSLKGNVEQLRDAYKEAQQEAYNTLVISGKDSEGNDILKNANTVLNGDTFNPSKLEEIKFIEEIESALQDTEHLAEIFDSLSDRSYQYTMWFNKLTGLYNKFAIEDLSADDLHNLYKELEFTKNKYQLEVDEAVGHTRTLLEAYLNTSEAYKNDELDDEAKRIASILVNNIDEEIAAGFKKNPQAVNDYVLRIIDALQNPDIHNSLVNLFTLDVDELSVNEAKEKIDEYIKDVSDALEIDEHKLKIMLGFEDIDTLARNYEEIANRAAAKFSGRPGNLWGGGKSLDAAYLAEREALDQFAEENSINTQEEIAFWNQCLEESNIREQAMQKYLASPFATAEPPTPLTITETVTQIDTRLRSAFSSLKSAYQEIFTIDEDTGEKLFTSLDEADITDKFKPVLDALESLDEIDGVTVDYSAYEDFVSVLSDTSSTAGDVQEQFDKLATDIIYTSECTNMSAETFGLLAESLSEMGVTNAYEILGKIRDAQEELADAGYDVTTITSEEAKELINLGIASVETEEYLRHYLIQKQLAQNPLSTLEDILQLESLCNSLGITGELLETVTRLKLAFEARESGVHSEDLDKDIKYYNERIAELAAGYGTFSFDFNGADTKSSSGSKSSSAKDTTETFDWIQQAIENVEDEIKELDEIVNSSYSTFSQKNEALAQEIRKVSDEIDLQQQAYTEYMRKADSIGLSDQYKQLVQSGAVNIEDIADENLQKMIDEYQKWYEKAQSVSDAIRKLKTDMKDLYVSAYELQTGNLKDRLDSDSITQKQYLDGLKEAYEKFYADLEDFAEQYHEAVLDYLSKEKDYLNDVAGAAASIVDTEIDKIQKDADSQESILKKQIDLLEAKKKPLQDELDALEDKAKRENLILNLQKAQYELARSENQRTKLLYKDGQMVYTSDPEAIRDAQEGVDDAKLEIQKQSIQDQIDALDDEIDRYNDLIDQINKAADTQIDALEQIKNKWQEVIDQQEHAKNISLLTGEFGTDAVTKILTGNDDDLLTQWKNNYITALAGIDMESQGYIGDMTQQIASLYDVDLSPLQSQFQNVADSIGGVTDALGGAASAIGTGINVPVYDQNAGEPSVANESLSGSITNLGTVSDNTLPNVTSNIGAIEETAINAASEVENVADAIENIPDSKDVTINIHTVGGNVSGGIASKVSQIAYTGNAYADGTRHAEKGLAVVGEEKPEVIVTNDKKALIAEQPTLVNMEGGETVFDGDETAKMLSANGLRPVSPDEFPLLKVFSQFSHEEIRQRFSLGQISPPSSIVASAVQNAGNVSNTSNNKQTFTIENVNINCPGVTKDEVAKQIGAELDNAFSGLSLRAYQRASITR